jgi:hypothetical protein
MLRQGTVQRELNKGRKREEESGKEAEMIQSLKWTICLNCCRRTCICIVVDLIDHCIASPRQISD